MLRCGMSYRVVARVVCFFASSGYAGQEEAGPANDPAKIGLLTVQASGRVAGGLGESMGAGLLLGSLGTTRNLALPLLSVGIEMVNI